MSGKTEFVMPSAAEQLRAEEAMLRIDWDRLHAMVEAQAEAMIHVAAYLGPKKRGGPDYDPVRDEGMFPGCGLYCQLARALGIL